MDTGYYVTPIPFSVFGRFENDLEVSPRQGLQIMLHASKIPRWTSHLSVLVILGRQH